MHLRRELADTDCRVERLKVRAERYKARMELSGAALERCATHIDLLKEQCGGGDPEPTATPIRKSAPVKAAPVKGSRK